MKNKKATAVNGSLFENELTGSQTIRFSNSILPQSYNSKPHICESWRCLDHAARGMLRSDVRILRLEVRQLRNKIDTIGRIANGGQI